jgi:hypothetical protein
MTLGLVKPPGVRLFGLPRTKNQIMLKDSADSLDFFTIAKAAGKHSIPSVTGQQLCTFLGVTADRFQLLIRKTLNADEGEEARDILVQAGIDIDPEADNILEDRKMNAQFQGVCF